ncbi:MAG: hypothetical protein Q9208_005053 [Pyrenodesmia sp. 3 TL-2023]
MAILNEVEVRVVSKATGQSLDEYDKPGSALAINGSSVEKYIEARTGEDFAVEIRVKEGFDCFRAWGIRIGLEIDGGVVNYCRNLSKEKVSHYRTVGAPAILDSVRQSDGKVHSRIGFQFGLLTMNEEANLPQEELENQARKLGLIRIYVERVNVTKLSQPKKRKGLLYKPLPTLEAPKELIKDKHISSVFQPGTQTPASGRGLRTEKYTTYIGNNSSRLNFHFYYRSEMHLRLLNCLPRSPIPDPPPSAADGVSVVPAEDAQSPAAVKRDPTAVKTEVEETADNNNVARMEDATSNENHDSLAEEVRQLKQQLQENQERQTNLMQMLQAAFGAPTVPTSAASSSVRPVIVKRERVKQEDDDETSGQTPRSRDRPAKRNKVVVEID